MDRIDVAVDVSRKLVSGSESASLHARQEGGAPKQITRGVGLLQAYY
jgi:hypothetical protein